MLKQSLSQRMVQKLSPQQIQLMKLLQIPTATLDQRIKEELESNPALEESEDFDNVFDSSEEGFGDEDGGSEEDTFELDDYLKEYIEDDPISYKLKGDSYVEEESKSLPMAVASSFHEHLLTQLGMMEFDTDREALIAEQIIGSIDEDGYLRRDVEALVDDMLFTQSLDTTSQEIERVLVHVQGIDPVGTGARDLQECLMLQMKDRIKKEEDIEKLKAKKLGLKILDKYFNEFSKKHYNRMKRSLSLSDSELKDAIDEILKLNPKPSIGYDSNNLGSRTTTNQYVVPDFIIMNRDGELELTLNNKNAPDLRISDHYMDVLKGFKETTEGRRSTKKEKEAVMFIKQKIDSAKWFIDAIKQRQETLFNTMYTIMQFQLDYFKTGDDRRIRPMILKDIAEVTGLDISTVSRVANSKFVQTEFGTKRLKDFFSESITTQSGEEVSTLEVKNILSEIINREDKRKPLSDERLKDLLQERGYNIARRTVAKYREQLNIPVARLRKQL
ncbi:MAG: RNA polymerase factor sigma-54 [Bacteroidota bacterium]